MSKHIKHFEDLRITVVATPSEATVDYVAYRMQNVQGKPHEYERREAEHSMQTTANPDEAEPLVKGFVRFDGCSNWQFDKECMVHACTREELVAIGEVLARCYDWTEELITMA